MPAGEPRYVLRRERRGGLLFDRQTGRTERLSEGHYILLERAHNLGTGASGVRKFLHESFADERDAEGFLSSCVQRSILQEERASSLQIITSPLPPESLPVSCHAAPSRLYWRITCRDINECGDESHDIDLKKALSIIKNVADAGTFELWVFGGEPTMHPYFTNIIDAAKENGLFVTVETHATFSESIRNKMLDSLIDRFAVIVAGGAITHNALFGEGAYAQMVEFISRLAQRGKKHITLAIPLGNSNIEKLQDAIGMGKAVRSEELLVMPGVGDEKLTLDKFSGKLSDAASLAEGLGVLISTPVELHGGANWQITGCPAGVSEAYLDHKGMLRACRYCDNDIPALGDILDLGYLSLWLDNTRFKPYREDTPGCLAEKRLFKADDG